MRQSGSETAQVVGLFIGKTAYPWAGKPGSAIAKSAHYGRLGVSILGIEGDEQADPEVHGGPDQAIHHYASEHMSFWNAELPGQGKPFRPGCFGENVSTIGFTEETLCIGDILTLGTAIIQVSQGRKPCWKLDAHIGQPGVAYRFQKTARTGWYYRVLETGTVEPGGEMSVLERPEPRWPIIKVTRARFDPTLDRDTAQELAELAPLSRVWRTHFRKVVE